jgi:hypothetical protein
MLTAHKILPNQNSEFKKKSPEPQCMCWPCDEKYAFKVGGVFA